MPAGAHGIDAAWYNPADLARIEHREIAASYQSMVANINHGSIGLVLPFNRRPGIAAYISYLDYGDQDRTTISTAGAFVTPNRAGTFSARDFAFGVAAGRQFTDLGSAGAALKVINSSLDRTSATAIAADLGVAWRLANGFPISFGATMRNLGTRMKFDRVSEDLPLTFQLGATATLFDDRLALFAAGERVPHENLVFRGGLEARPLGRLLALRVGYDGSNDAASGLTAGLGVSIESFTLDYAYIPFGVFGDNHRVALTMRF
jgi:hypothetical protein